MLVRAGGGPNTSAPVERTFVGLSVTSAASAEVLIDRLASCASCRAYRNAMVIPGEHAPPAAGGGGGRPYVLRIFVDHSVVTVFAPSGKVLTARVYPGADSLGVWLVGGGAATGFNVTAWSMDGG